MTPCYEIAFDGGDRMPSLEAGCFSFVVVELRKPEISTSNDTVRSLLKPWNHPVLTDYYFWYRQTPSLAIHLFFCRICVYRAVQSNWKSQWLHLLRPYSKEASTRSTSCKKKELSFTAEKEWRIWVSIPVPLACKASALPFELIPL